MSFPFIPVLINLVMSAERSVGDVDPGEPFDGRHGVPTRNEQAQWITVLHRQWLTVHGVREQYARVARILELQTALEMDRPDTALHRAAVGAAEHNFASVATRASAIEYFCQRHAGPFRRTDGTETPCLARDRRVEERPSVAGAFQRDDQRVGPHLVEIAHAQAQWPLHEAANRERYVRRVDRGNLEMVAHVKAGVWHHHAADQRRNRRFAVERM